MTDRYINPFTDFGFQKLFGSEPNKDLLLDFLNELIKERGHIQNLTYLKAEQLGLSEFERRMKAAGEPLSKIAAYTGLTAEQIRILEPPIRSVESQSASPRFEVRASDGAVPLIVTRPGSALPGHVPG